MLSGTWYLLGMPGTHRPVRRFRADDDRTAVVMALGLVKAQVRRQRGTGVMWRLAALAAGPKSEETRRVNV